jgi:Tfp pilus assembly protein FimV
VPDIAKEKIMPPKAVPDVRSASYGLIGEIESLVTSWTDNAIGLIVILLTLLGFVWYRKGKAAHHEQHGKLPVISEEIEETELAEAPAIAETSRTKVVQTFKTPAHTEQKIQSMLPPEYEMLEEADIYLRFGHDKLAEEALRAAIKINPRNPQAYLTLSRIYFSQEDTVAFLALAKQIKSLSDEDVWRKVAEMGRSLDPNNTLYN